ncbi:SAM-dependent methyltransferase [Pseudonocardiaceae bacterium YIM PH 21723]|nr:SAM-dependent methyltransferase [Pseudonocardiaceae bacterium YIM PH 21723]
MVYTHGHHSSVLRSHSSRTAANSAAYLLPHLRPEHSLLDVGCGPGTITADFAGLVGQVTAIEQNAEALALAEHTRDLGVRLEVADVHRLPFPDDSFDVVHAHQVLQHVTDPVQALREMRRVCKPGGLIAARDSDYPKMAWYPEPPELDEWMSLYLRTARHNGGEPAAGRYLKTWVQRAGCSEVGVGASTWCWDSAEERAWWGGMWADRILDSAIARQAVDYGYATPEDLARIGQAWRDWITAPDGWFAILHGELLARP